MNRKIFFSLVIMLTFCFGQVAYKSHGNAKLSPKMLNYQGYLTDDQGNPINGSVDMTFKIYDDSTGGNELWNETLNGVQVVKGIFNVVLGNENPIPYLVFTGGVERWLELAVSAQILSPRTRITAIAYAFIATYSDTSIHCHHCDTAEFAKEVDTAKMLACCVRHKGPDSIKASLGDFAFKCTYDGRSSNPVNTIKVIGKNAQGDMIPLEIVGLSLTGNTVVTKLFIDPQGSGRNTALLGLYPFDSFFDVFAEIAIVDKTSSEVVAVKGTARNFTDGNAYAGYFSTDISGTGTKYGVYATGPTDEGYAGYFDGNFTVVTGTKSAGVKMDNGEYRLLYCQESPENWFEDFGEGQLVNGKATIRMESLFLQTVNTKVKFHVFLTPHDEPITLAVTNRTPTSFEVKGPAGSNLSFSYRIVAKRRGFENLRLAKMMGKTPEEIRAEYRGLKKK